MVNRPPLLRKGSSGKRGSVCSEGGSSDDSGRMSKILENPRQGKRRASYFKTNNDFVMGIQEATLIASAPESDSSDDSDDEDSSSTQGKDTPVKKLNQFNVNKLPSVLKSPGIHYSPKDEINAHEGIIEESERTDKTEQSQHTMQSMKSLNEQRTHSNQELAQPLPSHYQSHTEIANRESYYEPNPVNPVAGNYYDYQYNGGAPRPSQPMGLLELKAIDVPQEYYNEVPNDPYETTPAHYTEQQYNSQMVPPMYEDPGYYYYDYVPVAEKRSEFETLAYQNSSYQQQQPRPEQQPEQQPEQYYYYHPQGDANNNYNGHFPVTNPAMPT